MEQTANCTYCKLLQDLPEFDSPFFFFHLDSITSTSCLLLLLLVCGLECVERSAVSPVKSLALISAGCVLSSEIPESGTYGRTWAKQGKCLLQCALLLLSPDKMSLIKFVSSACLLL